MNINSYSSPMTKIIIRITKFVSHDDKTEFRITRQSKIQICQAVGAYYGRMDIKMEIGFRRFFKYQFFLSKHIYKSYYGL